MNRRDFLAMTGTAALTLALPAPARAAPIRMRDLYNKDLSFSDLAQELQGDRITVTGFMAPPLKAEATFFVLTKRPMATCPFCETEADWPDDILAVHTKRVIRVVPFNVRIEASGVLALGGQTDPETGFVSRIRLTDASYR